MAPGDHCFQWSSAVTWGLRSGLLGVRGTRRCSLHTCRGSRGSSSHRGTGIGGPGFSASLASSLVLRVFPFSTPVADWRFSDLLTATRHPQVPAVLRAVATLAHSAPPSKRARISRAYTVAGKGVPLNVRLSEISDALIARSHSSRIGCSHAARKCGVAAVRAA